MALWIVDRTDDVDYDEYDAFVVRADDADAAVRAVWDVHGIGMFPGWSLGRPESLDVFRSRVIVKRLAGTGPREIILGSFNAG